MRILSPIEVLARFGRALGDPTRAAILMELRTGPAFPSDLAEQIGVSRQILSNHLACLRDCGLVAAEPDGRRVRYELSDGRLRHALDDLLSTILTVDAVCTCPDPECEQAADAPAPDAQAAPAAPAVPGPIGVQA
ncbi:ArsR/SmtB family transcription factor [Pseudarthrobacter phenanthrenivorans]|nr:metalloregulator ArsR/SmtB family transcription factor [Pseudarthrobacter phenanthrenivorans]